MVKTILVGIWVIAVLGGTSWFFANAASQASNTDEGPKAAYFGGLDYIKVDTLVIPSVRENAIHGYFVLDAVYTMKESKKSEVSIPIEYLLKDILTEFIYGNTDIDANRLEKFDKRKFQTEMVAAINEKLGEKVVYEVLIQKFDFISKEEIRDIQIRRS